MNKKDYYWAKYMLIFSFFCISFGTSIFLKTEHAPDEAMRMLIPEYIVSHHTLPNGMEESVRHPLWGFSYALYPYLTAIISSVFMAITSLFTKSAAALLTAARLTSVLSGTGTLIVVFLIGEELFERRESALLGGIFVGFLPQFVFLSCYVNNDSFAVFTVALIIYFWIRGMKSAFCKKDCIGLGAGCGLCALSYYNAYAYLLCSILLFFALMIHFRKPAKEIFVKALAVFAIAFLIGGWFFIRNAVIHDGDLLGMRTSNESAALYAADEYKPENRQTPASEGWSFQQTYLQTPEGRTSNFQLAVLDRQQLHRLVLLHDRPSPDGALSAVRRPDGIRIPSVFVPRHGSALVPQKAAASPLCDAVPRLPGHAVHGHVQHVFQRLPVSGPLPDAGARPSDDLDRRRLLFSHRETSRRVEARLLPSDTPAWNDLAGTVPHQLHRISDSGLLYGILNVFRTSKSAAKNFFLLFFAALLLFF